MVVEEEIHILQDLNLKLDNQVVMEVEVDPPTHQLGLVEQEFNQQLHKVFLVLQYTVDMMVVSVEHLVTEKVAAAVVPVVLDKILSMDLVEKLVMVVQELTFPLQDHL